VFESLGSKGGDLGEAKPFNTEEAIFNSVCTFFRTYKCLEHKKKLILQNMLNLPSKFTKISTSFQRFAHLKHKHFEEKMTPHPSFLLEIIHPFHHVYPGVNTAQPL
jgi:hypothetical protein